MGRWRLKTAAVILTAVLLIVGIVLLPGCGEEDVRRSGVSESEEQRKGEDEEMTGECVARICLLRGGVPEEVDRPASQPGAKIALEILLEGPSAQETDDGLITAIPEGTRLLEYSEVREGGKQVAVADFSQALLDYGGGSANVEAIESQITGTVRANSQGVEEVRILVAGAPAEEVLQP